MPEYIEREALIENLKRFAPEHFDELIQMLVEKQPAADVAPVVHGEWIHNTKREYDYICSVCRVDAPEDRYRNNAILTPYCPHCGAVMDGGKK